jgi:hypothetical protein
MADIDLPYPQPSPVLLPPLRPRKLLPDDVYGNDDELRVKFDMLVNGGACYQCDRAMGHGDPVASFPAPDKGQLPVLVCWECARGLCLTAYSDHERRARERLRGLSDA